MNIKSHSLGTQSTWRLNGKLSDGSPTTESRIFHFCKGEWILLAHELKTDHALNALSVWIVSLGFERK